MPGHETGSQPLWSAERDNTVVSILYMAPLYMFREKQYYIHTSCFFFYFFYFLPWSTFGKKSTIEYSQVSSEWGKSFEAGIKQVDKGG